MEWACHQNCHICQSGPANGWLGRKEKSQLETEEEGKREREEKCLKISTTKGSQWSFQHLFLFSHPQDDLEFSIPRGEFFLMKRSGYLALPVGTINSVFPESGSWASLKIRSGFLISCNRYANIFWLIIS